MTARVNNNERRTFINLEVFRGEDVIVEFDVQEAGEQLYLEDYTFKGILVERGNPNPVAEFTFTSSEEEEFSYVASISAADTLLLTPQVYKFEMHMTLDTNVVLLSGTLLIRDSAY